MVALLMIQNSTFLLHYRYAIGSRISQATLLSMFEFSQNLGTWPHIMYLFRTISIFLFFYESSKGSFSGAWTSNSILASEQSSLQQGLFRKMFAEQNLWGTLIQMHILALIHGRGYETVAILKISLIRSVISAPIPGYHLWRNWWCIATSNRSFDSSMQGTISTALSFTIRTGVILSPVFLLSDCLDSAKFLLLYIAVINWYVFLE